MSNQHPNEEPEFVDKRRIDPETGKLREPAADAEPTASAPGDDDLPTITDEQLQDLLGEAMGTEANKAPAAEDAPAPDPAQEHLNDLRRVQAEYANYRRRSERETAAAGEAATANVVKTLLPVLDDLNRAEKAGDLAEDSAMGVIAQKLRGAVTKLGVEAYGAAGDPFDPKAHEAIAQLPNPEVQQATIADVVELGYRLGERELRPAKVAVFVPAE